MGISIGKVIQQLRAEGFPVTVDKIHWAFRNGLLKRPPMFAGRYAFKKQHVAKLRRYFENKAVEARA